MWSGDYKVERNSLFKTVSDTKINEEIVKCAGKVILPHDKKW